MLYHALIDENNVSAFLSLAEKASTTEIRYTKLKEKHNELINTHAELLRKVMVPMLRGDTSVVIVKCLPHSMSFLPRL